MKISKIKQLISEQRACIREIEDKIKWIHKKWGCSIALGICVALGLILIVTM